MSTKYGKTEIVVCENERDLGRKAAAAVAAAIRQRLRRRDQVTVVFAAGQSQGAFLASLAEHADLEWGRVICQGIGTSGHLAFNEPGRTDFDDKALVRVVQIAPESKKQLIEDPNFKALGYIPEKGITLTIPALLAAAHRFTFVPLRLKRPILSRVLATPVPTPELPATILSEFEGTMFVDRDSCPEPLLPA